MSNWGIAIFIIGLVVYFLIKKNNDGLARFMLFVSGAGLGILVGAIWAYIMVDKFFG